jgi:hypothetical protein
MGSKRNVNGLMSGMTKWKARFNQSNYLPGETGRRPKDIAVLLLGAQKRDTTAILKLLRGCPLETYSEDQRESYRQLLLAGVLQAMRTTLTDIEQIFQDNDQRLSADEEESYKTYSETMGQLLSQETTESMGQRLLKQSSHYGKMSPFGVAVTLLEICCTVLHHSMYP